MTNNAGSHLNVDDISPLIFSLFPESEQIVLDNIPLYNITSDWWVVGNNSQFNTQWIQCSYPISGSYGPTPRYLYYTLVLFALLKRRSAWIVTAALGSVMTYSATAAIHAVVLVSIQKKLIPRDIANWMVVLVEGTAGPSGEFDGTGHNGLWLPVVPMAWDNDVDPVLAIVGTAFLVLLPMQIWSNTFKKSPTKSVLYLWSGILLLGTLSALINAAYTDFAAYTQLRFCPPGKNDTIPLTNSGVDNVGTNWAQANDPYYWNTTVYDYFGQTTSQHSNTCLYPCFATSWPLRDPTEIIVNDNSTGAVADSDLGWWLFIAVYVAVFSSTTSLLTIFAIEFARKPPKQLQSRARLSQLRIYSALKPAILRTKEFLRKVIVMPWPSCFARDGAVQRPSRLYQWMLAMVTAISQSWLNLWAKERPTLKRDFLSLWNLYVNCINLYAKYVSPVVVLFFVIWIEWYMWTNDPPGENFKHIGQWGALVAAGVVMIGAFVGYFFTTSVDSAATNPAPTNPAPIQLSNIGPVP